MSQEVILMEDVPGLGEQGAVVKVADGYARNFLLPRSLAAPVTEATRRRIEKKRQEAEAVKAKAREEKLELVKTIEKLSCTIAVKTGAEGKMFGSVTSMDVAAHLEKQGVKVDRHQIELPEPIKELGVFKVPVFLMPDIKAELKVWVVEE
jgi:large subunit ribosomal protein L9